MKFTRFFKFSPSDFRAAVLFSVLVMANCALWLRGQLLTAVELTAVCWLVAGLVRIRAKRAGLQAARDLGAAEPSAQAAPAGVSPEEQALPARKIAVAALHGSLSGFNQRLDTDGPEAMVEALNDYFTLAAAEARSRGGHFERFPGASFGVTWELGGETGGAAASAQAVAHAIRCALAMRQEMLRLNESRRLDGRKIIHHTQGLHVGQALAARMGVTQELQYCVTGEATACARALDRLALAEGKDIVISQDAIRTARGVLGGKTLGEARLTADSGLVSYYSVVDFREDESAAEATFEPRTQGAEEVSAPDASQPRLTGGETRVHIVKSNTAVERWLVNNGSQLVGPFTAREISARLFSQELDFDSECWHEISGRSSRIESAGIFSGGSPDANGDAGAKYWIYDQEMVHGPVTEGFLRTALEHGALGEHAMVCEKSTVAGWRRLAERLSELTARKPDKGSDPRAA